MVRLRCPYRDRRAYYCIHVIDHGHVHDMIETEQAANQEFELRKEPPCRSEIAAAIREALEEAEKAKPIVHIVPYHFKMETEQEEEQGRCLNQSHFGPCPCRHCNDFATRIAALRALPVEMP